MHMLINGVVPAGGDGGAVGGSNLTDFPIKMVFVYGDMNGATFAIECSPDGDSDGAGWFPVLDKDGAPLQFTDRGCENIVAPGAYLRATVTGAAPGDPTGFCAIA